MKRLGFLALLGWSCVGCVHTCELKSIERVGSLRTNATALVALPEDVQRGEMRYPGSGHDVALRVKEAFAARLDGADLTLASGDWRKHLQPAKQRGFDYLVVPMVTAWEDRKSKWRGRSQLVEIELQIIETRNGKALAAGRVMGKLKWGTNNDGPQELLEPPLRAYIQWLISPADTPLPYPRIEPAQSEKR